MGWASRRANNGRRMKPIDPPMKPIQGSAKWIESGPGPILDDPDLATLIVRIGMATNALTAQMNAGRDASRARRGAAKVRDILSSLVTTCALTNEALVVAQSGMAVLRPLARRAGAKEFLLQGVGKLCAGKHPANRLLDRARNNVGFHWDADLIGQSVREYGKNRKIVWIESEPDFSEMTHRLAFEVLTHALFPTSEAGGPSKATISAAFADISGAMDLIIEFFTASTYGYLRSVGAEQKNR